MQPSTKQRLIRLAVFGLIVIAAVFAWMQYTLHQSKSTADQIGSRAVSDVDLNDTPSTPEYLAEQQAMADQQDELNEAMDIMMEDDTPDTLAQGTFNRLDPIHRAEGTVSIIGDETDVYISFPEDFRTGNGPDLYVVLTQGTSYDAETSLNLGPLVSIEGKQTYKVTREEWEQYKNGSVLIWCRAFDVDFSVAELREVE